MTGHPDHRVFAVSGRGEAELAGQITPELSAAYDVMQADGVPEETIINMLAACQKSGRDPLQFARHFVKLRQGVRHHRARQL